MTFSSADQWLRRRVVFATLAAARLLRKALTSSERTYRLLFVPGLERARWRFGKWRAWLAYEQARRRVPAYREFVAAHATPRVRARGLDPDLSVIPITDKDNYVRRYSIESRCVNGRIPSAGVVIDESSGTSGTANNWVRGRAERDEVKQALQVALHHQLGREPLFVINAFALGPWATGMNVSMSVVDVSVLKSTGPDVDKIASTLRTFGPSYRYLLAGYPPFLKTVVDSAGIAWDEYDVTAIYGGEGMTETMREYLRRAFKNVYGSYGASDLEINLAAENDFTIALRRLLDDRDDLLERVGRPAYGVLPMVFQYNPIDYHIEEAANGNLVVTLCRRATTAPKIRYDIRDLGHVVRFPELRRALRDSGVDLASLPPRPDLPLLFLYGRADDAIPYYGCKLTPADVEEAVYSLPELAPIVNAFALLLHEEDAEKRLAIALELHGGVDPPSGGEQLRERVVARLTELNQDFREAARFMPPAAVPTLELHAAGTGPFAGHDVRLKRRYVVAR